MKKLFTSLFLLSLFTVNVFALSGGPDLYGYTWKDSNEPGGPVFNWIDISSGDRKISGLADDNFRGPFNISHYGPAYFKFYWQQIDKFWVGSNGYISFGGSILLASPFPNIPDSNDTRHNFIAGFLGDLSFDGTGNPAECYYRDSYDSLIISYINVPFYSPTPPYWTGSNTFQIILDKIDYSITINFLNQSGFSYDGDVHTGIENLTGTIGLQPFSWQYPANNYTIKYYYPSNPTYFVTDAATKWNTWYGSGGLFVPYPGSHDLITNVGNTGNLDIPPTYTVTSKIKNFSGTLLLSDTVIITDSLFIYQDTLVDFPSDFNIPGAGTYSFTSRLTGVSGDNIKSNDSVIQEIVAIDTSQNYMTLNYSDNSADFPGISWVDGTGGIGVYFVPPYYPCKIVNTKFFIESNPSNATFIGKIYDDNGPNNEPGTLLDSVMLTIPVFVGGYNTIIPSNPVAIYDGGVYVAWEMYGVDIALARDITPPISKRTFEYVGGTWSEYRSNQAEDFLITCTIEKHYIEDVGTTAIAAPLDDTISDPVTVSVWVKNYGSQIENTFDVCYKAWGQTTITEAYNGAALNPGDSALFTFATQVYDSSNLSGNICAWTKKLNDADANNDTSCRWLTVYHPQDTTQDTSFIGEYLSEPEMSIYPNPAQTSACIRFSNPDHQPYELRVYDVTGKLVHSEGPYTCEKLFITKDILKPGVYIVELAGYHIMHAKLIMQ